MTKQMKAKIGYVILFLIFMLLWCLGTYIIYKNAEPRPTIYFSMFVATISLGIGALIPLLISTAMRWIYDNK